ncbi:MAG: SUMF1/EgtB/PvdO family nonheme iron enzyme [Deltaproteobacteria bacterium]|nr:SUMF1/EgtB/PvdO family nonheme iron enzyme [Deltaproteobacteria bacterium]
MQFGFRILTGVVVYGFALMLSSGSQAVEIEWAEVDAPGNAADEAVRHDRTSGYGAVDYVYCIGKYEVTNAQYAEFLTAVATDDDTYGLYNLQMGLSPDGGIARSGDYRRSYSYSTIAGRANMPVNLVSLYDSLRFVNWLENGQPTGAQDHTTTEDGAYTFVGSTTVGEFNRGSLIFLPTEDEWYKAAYYDPSSGVYFEFPAGSNSITCAESGVTSDTANCNRAADSLTEVGSYTGAASPNGTYDQGGNVWEWSETVFSTGRVLQGGGFTNVSGILSSRNRIKDNPSNETYVQGFRVATVPEPSGGLLAMTALLALGYVRRVLA